MAEHVKLWIDLNDAGLDLEPEELEAYSQRLVADLKEGLAEDAALARSGELPEGSKAGAGFDLGIVKAEVNVKKIQEVLGWLQSRIFGVTLKLEYGDIKLEYRTPQELEQQSQALEKILKQLQPILGLLDENVRPIEAEIMAQFAASQTNNEMSEISEVLSLDGKDDLRSEKGIDYTELRDLLKAQDWQAADSQTYQAMIRALGKRPEECFTEEELLNFPCTDLKTINALWVKYSNGHFGFSVQKQIYIACGAKLDGKYPGDEMWIKFGETVGWRKNHEWQNYYDLFEYSPLSFEKGKFPVSAVLGWVGWMGWGLSILSHRDL